MAMSATRLVIGLDYGTTYSGVAYCDNSSGTADVSDIQIIHSWPGTYLQNTTGEKVPSQVSYQNGPNDFLWGGHIPPKANREIWTKLRLDKTDKGEELRMLLELITGVKNFTIGNIEGDNDLPPSYPGKDPVDIVTDFLTGLKNHVWAELAKTYQSTLNQMRITLVMTVPAVWSDRAKDLTFKAVTRAGFDPELLPNFSVIMVSEPEAAAIYTLQTLKKNNMSINVGDCFVLCDAGGGTVDLISYKVVSVAPAFRVEEAAIGSGDKCGGSFVDRNFKTWLKNKLGESQYNRIQKDKLVSGSKIMQEFEALKCGFSGADHTVQLTLPTPVNQIENPAMGIEDGEISISKADFEEIFDPCINRTLELIDGQIQEVMKTGSRPKHVFLVGGFGKSPYMFKRVQDFCVSRGLTALSPPFPWSAISRGACARGLQVGANFVSLRKCRRHYGTPISEQFVPLKHNEQDAYIDELTGGKYARGCMHWLIERGAPLTVDVARKGSIECCRTFEPTESRVFGAKLAACDTDSAPSRYADDLVYVVATLNADLTTVPDHKFHKARSGPHGKLYYVAEFVIEFELKNEQIVGRLLFEGVEYGSVAVKYE